MCSMIVAMIFSLLATCAAVDYRSGCTVLPKKQFLGNDRCVHRLTDMMQSSFAWSMLVDEGNVFMWDKIIQLTNEYDYEFSKSWKTTSALKRVAVSTLKSMRTWRRTFRRGRLRCMLGV